MENEQYILNTVNKGLKMGMDSISTISEKVGDQNFKDDLPKQIADFKRFSKNKNLCVIGDYNITFSDNYYFTNFGRNELKKSFEENEIENYTQDLKETIDHIAISKKFNGDFKIETTEWNIDKKLSDHKGVSINWN